MVYPYILLTFAAFANAQFSPTCGTLGGAAANANSGVSLDGISTVVAFGDGYTDGGRQNGSTLPPPVQSPPDPRAGGRLSNGKLWVEYFADSVGATLKDYAVSGSVVDNTLYPGVAALDPRDFMYQANLVISGKSKPDPDSTLYITYLGMEDFKRSSASTFPSVADSVIYELLKLSSSPLFAKNFLVVDSYGRGTQTAAGDAYKQELFDGLTTLASRGINVAFVDMGDFITDVTSDIQAAGFSELGPCTINATTTVGECADPADTVYYIQDYPSTNAHELMAQYAQAVITQCT
ncbi:hypothetical protein BDZ89DRAFT_1127368 [Hymenopellis radicata]|nr:hypothetical protein BDZ89DRAFT_1127368 [Hymenopellis radicata]